MQEDTDLTKIEMLEKFGFGKAITKEKPYKLVRDWNVGAIVNKVDKIEDGEFIYKLIGIDSALSISYGIIIDFYEFFFGSYDLKFEEDLGLVNDKAHQIMDNKQINDNFYVKHMNPFNSKYKCSQYREYPKIIELHMHDKIRKIEDIEQEMHIREYVKDCLETELEKLEAINGICIKYDSLRELPISFLTGDKIIQDPNPLGIELEVDYIKKRIESENSIIQFLKNQNTS